MKIGIVSIYDNGNLGNRLQNFALQEILKKYADEVVTIKSKTKSKNKLDQIVRALNIADVPFVNSVLGKKKRAQILRFTNRYIDNSKKYYYHDQKYSYPIENCDLYCSGSDQVWNPNLRVTGPLHYLGFSNKERNFSFSASFGIDHIDDQETRDQIAEGLNNFHYISVREDAGKKIIKEDLKIDKDIQVLIDPTLYFDADDWVKVEERPKSLMDKRYVLTYFLGGCSKQRFSRIEKVAAENECIIIDLLDSKSKLFSEIGPSEFVYLVHHASLVCTDSYHASVFSFIFERPLYIFNREGKKLNMGSRITTLVNKFGLNLIEETDEKLTIFQPDYSRGYENLASERKKVDEYLNKVFSKLDPSDIKRTNNKHTEIYACYNINDEIRRISSSGGIYYLLAEQIISAGDVVYAACYEGLSVKHIRIDKKESINQSCGAKYIQSELGNTFKSIIKDLENGLKVMFVGQPCQCAGLRKLVENNTNLICVDFVCHGIPEKYIWQKYVESMKQQGISIRSVNMRDKSSGWRKYNWLIETEDGKSIIQPRTENAYMKGFLKDLYLRSSCYQCKFKGVNRNTDITLGDYWGIEAAHPFMFDDKGVSLVMIHSEKGRRLFYAITPSLCFAKSSVKKATKANPSIIICPVKPKEASSFRLRMERGDDFCKVVDELTQPNRFRDFFLKIDRKIKRITTIK